MKNNKIANSFPDTNSLAELDQEDFTVLNEFYLEFPALKSQIELLLIGKDLNKSNLRLTLKMLKELVKTGS